MRSTKLGTWITGTVVVALAIVAGGWFLLVSPVLATATETHEEAVSAQDSNAMLETKIARLAQQFKELDAYKAELAALQVQVPTSGELASYLRQLDAIAAAHAVTITSVLPSAGAELMLDPTTVAVASSGEIAAVVDAAPAPVAEEADADGASGDAEAPAPADPGPTAPAGLIAVPISITAMGTYDDVVAFLGDLQGGTDRLLLVTAITGSRLNDAVAAGGRPASSLGDLEVDIAGTLYVLPLSKAPAEVDQGALPATVAGKNPLVPLG